MPTQHEEWKKLKDTHAALLKQKKIVFNRNLGPLLDTLHKLRDKGDLPSRKIAKETGAKAAQIADTYLALIRGKLGDPAESQFRSRLILIRTSCNSFR